MTGDTSATDRLYHNPADPEEWFGIIGIDGPDTSDYRIWRKEAYWEVQAFWGDPETTSFDYCDGNDTVADYGVYNPRPGENILIVTAETKDMIEGEGAIRIDYSLANSTPASSTFVVLQTLYVPEQGFNWSRYGGLSIYHKTTVSESNVIFRIQIFDESEYGGQQEGWKVRSQKRTFKSVGYYPSTNFRFRPGADTK